MRHLQKRWRMHRQYLQILPQQIQIDEALKVLTSVIEGSIFKKIGIYEKLSKRPANPKDRAEKKGRIQLAGLSQVKYNKARTKK